MTSESPKLKHAIFVMLDGVLRDSTGVEEPALRLRLKPAYRARLERPSEVGLAAPP